ncbi:Gmad2 immunoglobulin-like domain-containing protein [Sporosarcina siberiensis]|uniref:Gmad2 immunoglobulin-like domain-containing protein n=1 Tax=Sporosarcina siberiensis TaxID=1365606 RepID=A0ABW4SEM7_9BACL
MKNLFTMMSVLIYCLLLSACLNSNTDDNSSNINEDIQKPDVEIEKDPGKEQIPSESETPTEIEDVEKSDVVIENEAFQVFEPSPNEKVQNQIIVRGLARVFEGTLNYAFEDGHFIIDQGFVTASEGAPGWGVFEFTVNIENAPEGLYKILLFEKSAKDGSIINELMIPVEVSE